MTNFNEPTNVADLIGLWDFLSGNENADTGLDDGIAQDGNAVDGNGVAPSFSNDQLHVGGGSNSNPTVFDVNADMSTSADDEQFNLDRGTLEVQFTQSSHSGGSEDVVVSRGEKEIDEDDEGFFEIRVTDDGEVQSYHNTDDGDHEATLSTSEGFFSAGDVINVKYSFDVDTGARLTVENLTTGETESLVSTETGLTFDLTDNDDEEFSIGAREKNDGEYDKEFQGSVDYMALYTTTNDPITDPNPTEPNYIVEGTSTGELIDAGYTGDPEGDMIDALDNDLSPPNNDDVVEAGGGDDTVEAGDGDDTVFGGTGNDFILGDDDNAQAGDDLLFGEDGDDTLCGLDGDDTLDGGAGEDLLEGMEGDDLLLGGSGDDRAYGDNGDDTIFGDEGGQDEGASVREVFQWDLSPTSGASDFSQDTGNVTVSFSETNGGASDNISTDVQNVAGIETGTLAAADSTSSLDSETNGEGNSDTYTLDFSDPVEDVSFRVNDVDGDGVVRIQAFDADGNPIEVILEGGSNVTLLDTDGVAGNDTADSNGGYMEDTAPEYSVLVTIPGPVSEIKIFHTQDGDDNSGINVTDVYFDVPNVGAPEGAGNDTLFGGAGDDLIYGNEGDDSIQGNSGDDTLFGDDPAEGTPVGANLITNGSFEIGQADDTFGQADNQPGWYNPNGDLETWGEGFEGETAAEGSNFVELDVENGVDSVAQNVTTQDGQDYQLTFSLQQRVEGSDDEVEVYFGGQLVDTIVPGDDWTEYTYTVTGSGSDVLEFKEPASDNSTFGPLIDDVSMFALADAPGEGGNDTIEGGTGDDVIDGQGGDDVITGGTGNDEITGGDGADDMSGGDDRDTFIGGNDGDVVDGGTGSTAAGDVDDVDTLDLTGEGPFRVINETPDADGNSTSGTIEFLDGAGDPTGDTLDFTEIEVILGDRENQDPDADDDTGSGDEDTDITGNVLTNDSDPDAGDTLTVIDNTDPSNGTVIIDANGDYIYTPDDDFFGDDSFTYTVSDGNGGTDTATVNLTVNPVNDAPDAVDDSNSTDFETDVVINVLANDTDVDNPASDLTVTAISVPAAQGTLTPTGTEGEYTFTPADGFEGTATVSYSISDGAGGTDSATHTIEVGEDPTPQDGIVDGEESGEEMILGYDDSNLPTDQGGDIITNDDDEIEGNGGDDTIDGAGGDDTISGGDDDDVITGGDGDDIVNGDDGSDTLAGGEGDDTLNGGQGDDDIAVGGNDVADGGTGDDVFTVDTTDPTEPTDVTIDGGSDGTDGNPDGPENGDEGDVLDLGDQTADLTVDFDPNPEEGTVNGLDTNDDDPADITFEEIEKVITGSGDDVIDGDDATGGINVETGDGDDDITGGSGDDTIDAGDGDDDVEGGDGDDTLDGGDGSDTIAGGEGDDSITGGDGDDDIEVGAGDTAEGGIGDDVFTVDDTLTGDDPITVDGGSDGTQPGDEAGPENGDDGDTLDLRGLDLVSLVYDPTDPEAGTAIYNNDDGDPVTINFTEIEIVLHDPLPDGVVDGEETGEDMQPTYDDGEQATDNGGDIIDGPDGDDDIINGNGGDDTINAGQGSDTVSGGTGDDSIIGGASDDGDDLSGDEGDDTIQGGGGDDTIDGGIGDDVIEGGTGDDDITGGDGNDDVVGGEGNDTIDTSGTAPATDLDTPNIPPFITGGPGDVDPDDDKDTVDGGAGDDVISTGDDADVITGGTGEDTIDGGIDADTIDGGADNDSIIGGEGSDSILGGGGDDTIYGGLDSTAPDVLNVADDGFNSPIGPDPVDNNGDDFINGGAGNDLIFGQDDNDTILGGTGNDTIDGGVDDDSIIGGQGDDSIEGGHGQDFIQGNNDDDSISGGRGSDTLEGNAGDDTIIGGAGDSIIGGGGADSIFIDQDEVDENGDNDAAIFVEGNTFGDDNDTLDLTDFLAHRNLQETPDGDGDSTSGTVEVQNDELEWVEVTFNEIETLLLPPQAPDMVVDGEETGELMDPLYDDSGQATDGGGDIIDGADGDDDSIRGNGGDDTINAGEGDDTVDGGDDDDEVNGGTGNDIVGGGDGDDLVTGGFGDDTVTGGEGDDTLRGNAGDDSVVGGEGDDSMGGAEGDDTLEGGIGNDELDGGSGDDVLDGGEGNDTIEGASGNDTITDLDGDNEIISGNDGLPDLGVPFVPGTFDEDADPNDDRDSVTTGDGNDTISTGDDADTIDAGDGDNVIDGGFDADDITSGSGNDQIIGGEGSDTINSGAGDDTIQGGIGTDAANLIDDNVNPANNDDILDNGDDLINAGAGDDVVFGEDDNDTIDGGTGDDTLDGGIDDDTITGGEGDDVIIGGQGADSLDGGTGDDTFNVGTFTDPVFGDEYVEGIGDTVVGGEDVGDGDVDVLDLNGSVDFDIVYQDSIDPTGTPGESGKVIYYTDDTKTVIKGELVFKEIENVIPCFTPGAMIATPRGEVPVETLREGDKVITRDNGIQEIRWTGNRTLNRAELAEGDGLKPILINAGSLGRNLPERDMLVSPQHRVLITGETPQLYFEESEVLVAAKHLVGKSGVSIIDTMRTTYIHFMFERHEVVLSDGAWTESFQPGDQTLGAMGEASRDEIFALFPELATAEGVSDYAAARRTLKAHEAKLLQN